jgi:hypothetical protein
LFTGKNGEIIMSVDCTFYEHVNFAGDSESFTLSDSWRYHWIKFGSPLRNEISSFRASAAGGGGGNIYSFTNRNFTGDFLSLNMAPGWTCWWSNVGSSVNDDIESALLINRSDDELVLELEEMFRDPFIEQLDELLEGEDVRRNGNPRIFANFWPDHDPDRKFISIEQNLRVELDWWPDYDAKIRYDIYFYLIDSTHVGAYAAWAYTWVEGGVFSGKIYDQLQPRVVSGASQVNAALAEQLPLLSFATIFRGPFRRLYLLPGPVPVMPPPSSNFGSSGNSHDDACLVLTF